MNSEQEVLRAVHWDVTPTSSVLMDAMPLVLDMEADSAAIEQALSRDPVLVAMLLREVNSSLFHLANPVSTVRAALIILGRERLRDLCFTTLMRELVRKKQRSTRHSAWLEHSVATAILSETLRDCGRPGWSEAYTTGLLHDIGRLALIELVQEAGSESHAPCWGSPPACLAEERDLLGVDHCQAGASLLKQWRLAPGVVDACSRHHHLSGDLPAELVLLQLACALASTLNFGAVPRDVPPFDQIAARFRDATGRGLPLDLAGFGKLLDHRMPPSA